MQIIGVPNEVLRLILAWTLVVDWVGIGFLRLQEFGSHLNF